MGKIVKASLAVPLLAEAAPKPEYYDLRYYQLRNGYSMKTQAQKPAGAGETGIFSAFIGENAPFALVLQAHATMAEAEHAPEFDLDYVRCERTLLRAFTGMPRLQHPPGNKAGHIFEMRTYESNNASTLRKKIEMFNNGEMQIFQRLGMNPVFFGEALFGSKLPHLTYMLAFDDLAARDRLWKAFGSDPEWLKLKATPGLSDADIVSNISNTILRPTLNSDIR